MIDVSSDSPHLSTFGLPSSQPQVQELPTVEVTDTSFTDQDNNANGSFLTVPDRLAVEYKDDDKNDEQNQNCLSFDLPKIRTSMGKYVQLL